MSSKPVAFITGATGFIGSHTAEQLKQQGWLPRLLVRNRGKLPESLRNGVEVADGSLNQSPQTLAPHLRGCDYVFHIAGLIGAIKREEFERANVEGTANLIEAIRLSGSTPRRMVLVSSLATIGPCRSRDEPVHEDSPPNPRTMYGESKLKGERLAWELCQKYAIPLTVIRPPAVYGPRDWGIYEFFKYMARGIEVGIGKEKRYLDLIHGRDLARGMIMAAQSERAENQAYFITDAGKHEMGEVMGKLRAVMNPRRSMRLAPPVWVVKSVARMNDVLQRMTGKVRLPNTDKLGELLPTCWCCSGDKAYEHFGFRAEIPLEEGLRETAEWYKREGWIKVK